MRIMRAGCTAVVAVQLWFVPVATASPPLPSVDALSPGIGLATFDAALSDADTCTAGFLVRDRGGRVRNVGGRSL